mgnify:FL=1
MFYTKTEQVSNESLGIFASCESVEEALIESIAESYEDLANFNEALASFDIKEQELICSESAELDAFREEAANKGTGFLDTLVKKLQTRLQQFIAFVIKKYNQSALKLADKVYGDLDKNKLTVEQVKSALEGKDVKIKTYENTSASTGIEALNKCLGSIIDSLSTVDDISTKEIDDKFKAILGKEIEVEVTTQLIDIKAAGTEFKELCEDAENRLALLLGSYKTDNAEDAKENAKKANFVALKGRVAITVAMRYAAKQINRIVIAYGTAIRTAKDVIKKAKSEDEE